jgi:hypothetical protein
MKSFQYLTRLYFERKVLYGKEFFTLWDSIGMAKITAMELFGVLSPEFKEIEAELDLARKYLDNAEAMLQTSFKRISEKFKEEDQ